MKYLIANWTGIIQFGGLFDYFGGHSTSSILY